MEALALLCTLHADGPATLRRLRRAGCETLEALDAYEPDALADLLRLSPAAARRFEREARMLGARLTTGLLEREEVPQTARAVAPAEAGTYAGDTGSLERKDREILGKVLERWSSDETSAAGSDSNPVDRAVDVAPAPMLERMDPDVIDAELIDGLDAAHCAALAAAGVTDLEALVETAPLELAKILGEGFAQVRRWQFLARRIVDEQPSEEPASLAPSETHAPRAERAKWPLEREPIAASAPPITVRKPWPVQAVPESDARTPAAVPEPVTRPLGPLAAPEPPAPARGWEPRKFWEAPGHPEGSEAAQEAPARSGAGGEVPSGTTLNWNFEIPPPPPLPPQATHPDAVEQAGGPFA